jgi:hypothetical protein
MLPSGYSVAFEKLVGKDTQEPTNVVGLLAYALYKHDKRQWVKKETEAKGRSPTTDEQRNFEAYLLGEQNLRRYLEDADAKLNEMFSDLLEQAVEEQKLQFNREIKQDLQAIKHKFTFWGAVWPSLVSSVLSAVLLFLLWVVLSWYGGGDLTKLLPPYQG